VGEVTILESKGRLIIGEGASALRVTVRSLLAGGRSKFILNLAQTSYVDPSGIGELVSAFTQVTNEGGDLKLLSVPTKAQDILKISSLYQIFDVYDSEAAALSAFEEKDALRSFLP
jgi:anti-sigma B factor antagonist